MQRASVSHRKPHSPDTPRAQWPVYHGVEHAHESVERPAPDSTEWNRAQALGSWWHGMLSAKMPATKKIVLRERDNRVGARVSLHVGVAPASRGCFSVVSNISVCSPWFGRSLASGVKANDAVSTARKTAREHRRPQFFLCNMIDSHFSPSTSPGVVFGGRHLCGCGVATSAAGICMAYGLARAQRESCFSLRMELPGQRP